MLLLSTAALAQDRPARISERYREVLRQIEQMRRAKAPSVSVGEPNSAKLLNACELPAKGYGVRLLNAGRKTNFGTDEMVFGLMELGAQMGDRWGDDGTFGVGDISDQDGGKLSPHISHQGGRDADVGYYICDDKGRPQGNRMLTCGKDGTSKEGTLRFDVARNWEFVCAMMDSPHFGGEIRFILIAEWLKKLLVEHGEERAAKARTAAERDYHAKRAKRAEQVLDVKNDHDNHFHLRIKCTREDNKEG